MSLLLLEDTAGLWTYQQQIILHHNCPCNCQINIAILTNVYYAIFIVITMAQCCK